jgi:hypothetical protein
MRNGKICLLFTICAFAGGLSACSLVGKKSQTFEIIGPAEGITPEEEKAIKSQSTFIPVGAVSTLSEGKQTVKSVYPIFTIHKNESLYSAINRLNKISSYSRLIFDISPSAASPDKIKVKKSLTTKPELEPLNQLEKHFQTVSVNIRVFGAYDKGQTALVVSDKPYPSWNSLVIYDVPKGTLKDATQHLANTIGWSLETEQGYTAQNFTIDNSYPIVISPSDPKTTFTSLLSSYPAKAQLKPNTRTATIVARVLPKQN